MGYVLLTGDFHIHYPDPPANAWKNGPEPDGDTVRFRPDSPDLVWRLRRQGQPAPDINARGNIALRLEGIDALETHFEGGHQAMDIALSSRDFLLGQAGFGAISFGTGKQAAKVRAVERHPAPGWVLTNGLDGNGRIVGFVFFGSLPEGLADRAEVHLDAPLMMQSANVASLRQGMSYASFYFTLPQPLNHSLGTVARAAAAAGAGLHPADHSKPGAWFQVGGPDDLETLAIWPKLFRRLWTYFRTGASDLLYFRDWLKLDPVNRNDRFLGPDAFDLHFHNIVEVRDATTMRMVHDPADLVIIPDDFVMPDTSLAERRVLA